MTKSFLGFCFTHTLAHVMRNPFLTLSKGGFACGWKFSFRRDEKMLVYFGLCLCETCNNLSENFILIIFVFYFFLRSWRCKRRADNQERAVGWSTEHVPAVRISVPDCCSRHAHGFLADDASDAIYASDAIQKSSRRSSTILPSVADDSPAFT